MTQPRRVCQLLGRGPHRRSQVGGRGNVDDFWSTLGSVGKVEDLTSNGDRSEQSYV